jgi:tetratricopeptide (TPR) repeat protein
MKRNLLAAIALTIAAVLIYGQTYSFEFVNYDDGVVVYENDSFKSGLGWTGIGEAFRTESLGNWVPVTVLTYHADYVVYDDIAGGMHVTNLIFHLLNVLLLFGVMMRYTGAYWPSVFCACLFAVHPLHVESVAWVSERKDLVCGFFFLCTLWAYKAYTESGTWWRYGFVVVFTGLALLSKPMAVTLPCVLILLDFWPLNRLTKGDIRKAFLEKIPLFLVVIALSVITFQLQSDTKAMTGTEELSFLIRFQNALWSYSVYLGQTLVPFNLIPFYPHPGEALGYVKPLLSGLAVVLISIWVWRGRVSRPHRVTGWCWYLGMLVPVIGLIQVGGQSHADRYMYLPMIGLGILAFWELEELGFYRKKYLSGLVVLTSAMVVLGIAAYKQTTRWSDSVSLFEYTLEKSEKNPVGLSGLGEYYTHLEEWDLAEPFIQDMLEVHPGYKPSLINYGKLHYAKGDYVKAIQRYNMILHVDPGHVPALNNVGNAYLARGQYIEAEKAYRDVLVIEPEMAEAHANLGAVLLLRRHFKKALESLETATRLNPNDAVSWVNLGVIYFNLGDRVKALEVTQKAITIDPDYEKGHAFLNFVNSAPSE